MLTLNRCPFHPVLLWWHVKYPGHSAKSAGGRLHLNTAYIQAPMKLEWSDSAVQAKCGNQASWLVVTCSIHWQGSSLQNVSHFHTHSKSETYVLQQRKALISPAWSLNMLTIQPSPVMLLVFHLNTICQEIRKKAFCVTLTLEWGLLSSLQLTPIDSDWFIFVFRNPSLGTF